MVRRGIVSNGAFNMDTIQEQVTERNAEESPDEIARQIDELKEKLQKMDLEAEPEVKKVEYPIANVAIRIDRNMDVLRQYVTPPELQILVAMHQKGAGGMPVLSLKLMKEVRESIKKSAENEPSDLRKQFLVNKAASIPDKFPLDPRVLRNWLAVRYGGKRVNELYPGAEPLMPTTFRRALSLGSETKFAEARLFDMQAFGGGE